MVKTAGFGVIGTGYMGFVHTQAIASVANVFELKTKPRLVSVADISLASANALKEKFGFEKATADWRVLVEDPDIDIVSITTPNHLHKEMALAAIAAGKHVWCEKPLALNGPDAKEMAEAAKKKNVKTLVGYNYIRSPAIQFAKKLIDDGEIGKPVSIRCIFDEDYMGDPEVPYNWRVQKKLAGTGALGDLASHSINLVHFLVGPVREVSAQLNTVIPKRKDPQGKSQNVENDDLCDALVRFENGATGHIGASRIAWGRKNGLDFALYGEKGSIHFTQERFNEIQVYMPGERASHDGMKTILTGPPHPPFANFTPGYGHGIGFNDLKICEAEHFLRAIEEDLPSWPDFEDGYHSEAVCDAMIESASAKTWIKVAG